MLDRERYLWNVCYPSNLFKKSYYFKIAPKILTCFLKILLNHLEAVGVQGLVEVEEDPLVDRQLEREIPEGRPELFAQDVIGDLDCWVVSHNQ